MLPKNDLPTYELTLPSSGKEITVRPFRVKEEKLLLMAKESGELKDIIRTTQQVVQNCIVTKNIDVEKLPFFDVDYLIIALRAKSVGDSIDVKFRCNNRENDETDICGNMFDAKIDISNVKIESKDIAAKIRISNTITVKMKYPPYSVMKMIKDSDLVLNKKIAMIAGSIEFIQEKEKVLTNKDVTYDELVAFIEGLSQAQFKKLEEFIDNFPTFYVEAKTKCKKCGFDHVLQYKDFESFFE